MEHPSRERLHLILTQLSVQGDEEAIILESALDFARSKKFECST